MRAFLLGSGELLWGANGWLLCKYEVLGIRYMVVRSWILDSRITGVIGRLLCRYEVLGIR